MSAPDVTPSAPLDPFTQPWADAYRVAIDGSAEYREAGRGWTWPLALVLEPAPEVGIGEGRAVALTLERGRCHAARAVAPDGPEVAACAYVMRAPYATWKRIVRGALDPVQAVVTGQLTLARGSLLGLMGQMAAARALVACARDVPTRFADEE